MGLVAELKYLPLFSMLRYNCNCIFDLRFALEYFIGIDDHSTLYRQMFVTHISTKLSTRTNK